MLVDCSVTYGHVVADSLQSMGGGGGSEYIPPGPNDLHRPQRVEGTFWIVGHPEQASKVDKDRIDVNACEDGVYSYNSVDGAHHRVKKYKVLKTYE